MLSTCLFHSLVFASLVFLCSSYSRYGMEYESSEPNACVQCMNNKSCVPPDCFCCRDELNLPISIQDIPQIVFFTFDDALTDSATKFYHQLFNESRKNPNGCPVSMTLFVSHHDTVYSNVNQMYRKGMEIAAHSVSHAHMSNENFMKEAQNQKQNLATLGGVPENEIVGWRSPFLEPVGDMQPNALKELGYMYDATLTFSKRSLKDKAPTPFTLDFGWPYDCKVKPCPKRRHFGFWEVPVVSLLDYLHQYDCVYVDGCNNPPPDETSAFKFLTDNFYSYYSKHRVPFGINMHPSWFYIPERLNAMDRFIQKLSNMNDVFIVSVKKMIDWLKNPTGLSQINNFKPWQCPNQQSSAKINIGQMHQSNNEWSRPDPVALRRNYIQARLEQIQEMRQQQQQAIARDFERLQQSSSARNNWWIHESGKHESHPPHPTKPAAIAPWVHKKHEVPVEQKEKIAMSTTSPIPASKEVPFWKRNNKNVSKELTANKQREAAWWEKAIPSTKAATLLSGVGNTSEKEQQHSLGKNNIIDIKAQRNTFDNNLVGEQKPDKHLVVDHHETTTGKPMEKLLSSQHKEENAMKSSNTFVAPPKVNFTQQLKEQELKQLEIIEKQKKLQQEQLRLQIQQLEKNNKEVFKRQQEEQAIRMKEIEERHMLALNQQKSLTLVQASTQNVETQEILLTTVQRRLEPVTSATPPESENFSLIPDKNSKTDPWTRFVQFIIRNKP